MYLNEVPDGQLKDDLAMVIEEVVRQRYQGVKNEKGVWVTPAFPKLIYVLEEDNITEDIYETARLSILHSKVKAGMPSNVDEKLMGKCNAPTLVMAAEKDCLFPGKGVIMRAQKIIPNCETYLLKGRGHMNFLTDEEKKMIVDFLLR